MKRRSFLQTLFTASAVAPAVVPNLVAMQPNPQPVEWTECGVFHPGARLCRGHLTIICGPRRSGKTHLLQKLVNAATQYRMPLLHADPEHFLGLEDAFESMFKPGRCIPNFAYAVTWPRLSKLDSVMLSLLERYPLVFRNKPIPVILVKLDTPYEPEKGRILA